jgi:deazaflavin-dependent oxidoreductase (nitroreductase family)
VSDWNQKVIEEFRANGGKVGGMFEGAPMLLLHTKGAKSGRAYVTPLMYQQVGDDVAVFASKGGAPEDPAWYHNLITNPDTEIELGSDIVAVHARVAEGEERDRIFDVQKERYSNFAEYEEKAQGLRTIPVVVLSRA